MRFLRLMSVSVLALSMGFSGAEAQNLRNGAGPAEHPPASFKGKQYVDSRGCVYIRAGFSGNVTWIPRVTRSRELVCGQQPTLRPSTKVAKAAPKAPPKAAAKKVAKKKVVKKTATPATPAALPAGARVIKKTVKVVPAPAKPKTTQRVVRKAVTAPKPQTRVVRKTVAAPKPQAQVVRRTVAAPKVKTKAQTRVVRQAVPAPKAQVQTVRRQAASKKRATAAPKVVHRCGASEFSSQFINDNARCGPQSGRSRSVVREEISPQSRNTTTQGQLVGPKGVNRKIAEARLKPPAGHKVAWKDDRLNPLRGVGTTSGKAQMELVWSNTVPRYLIDPATGKALK